MFVGRKRELSSLEKLYHQQGFGMTVIYGRRRIGKSTLIREFLKDKRAIFYTATKVGKARNLELFCQQVVSLLDPSLTGVSFPSLEAILDFITDRLSGDKLVLVIDELPYWAQDDGALLSVLYCFPLSSYSYCPWVYYTMTALEVLSNCKVSFIVW